MDVASDPHGTPMIDTDPSAGPLPRAWHLMFTSLCLSAGMGIGMLLLLTRQSSLFSNIRSVHDVKSVVIVLWFLLAVPLAILTVLLRRRLAALSPRLLRALAVIATGVTLVFFAAYGHVIAHY